MDEFKPFDLQKAELEQRTAKIAEAAKAPKIAFKQSLFELFEQGLVPAQITFEQIAKILNLPAADKTKVKYQLTKWFMMGSPKDVVDYVYKQYKENRPK